MFFSNQSLNSLQNKNKAFALCLDFFNFKKYHDFHAFFQEHVSITVEIDENIIIDPFQNSEFTEERMQEFFTQLNQVNKNKYRYEDNYVIVDNCRISLKHFTTLENLGFDTTNMPLADILKYSSLYIAFKSKIHVNDLNQLIYTDEQNTDNNFQIPISESELNQIILNVLTYNLIKDLYVYNYDKIPDEVKKICEHENCDQITSYSEFENKYFEFRYQIQSKLQKDQFNDCFPGISPLPNEVLTNCIAAIFFTIFIAIAIPFIVLAACIIVLSAFIKGYTEESRKQAKDIKTQAAVTISIKNLTHMLEEKELEEEKLIYNLQNSATKLMSFVENKKIEENSWKRREIAEILRITELICELRANRPHVNVKDATDYHAVDANHAEFIEYFTKFEMIINLYINKVEDVTRFDSDTSVTKLLNI